jgi:hypothetical protein
VGHALALKLAREAAGKSQNAEKHEKLMEAYLYEAFAAHFLTDLFSAGHIRAPRRQLHCNDAAPMAKAVVKNFGKFVSGKPDEVPIWDYHNRYVSSPMA